MYTTRIISAFLVLSMTYDTLAQVIPDQRITDWTQPGSRAAFLPQQSVVLTVFGADNTGALPCNVAMQAAIAALGGPGEILIPAGDYLFTQSIILPDSVILQGEVDPLTQAPLSRLLLNVGENADGLRIAGSEAPMSVFVTEPLVQGLNYLIVDQPALFQVGDHLRLHATDDASLVISDWSVGQTGQIVEVLEVSSDTLLLAKPLRRSYSSAPEIRRLSPRRQVHLRCLALVRQDATTTQTTNVYFANAVDCSMTGIDSRLCNYAHVNVFRSARITIVNSYFKDGHSYGSGGKAFGVLVDYGSGDCYVHQNNFEHLRHSMIVQAGANGNVFAYNRSVDPFWTGTLLPANAAGDLVLHGNYPYMNLFEGNVVQNIVIDNSHSINGPYNTFFRDRAELFGIFMNSSPASNDQNFIGNQVTNTLPFYGQYSLQGTGHFTYGNQIRGTIQPPGTGEPDPSSMFAYPFPSFYQFLSSIPPVRNDNWQVTEPLIQAQYNGQLLGRPAVCIEASYQVGMDGIQDRARGELRIMPNPADRYIQVIGGATIGRRYTVFNATGKGVLEGTMLRPDEPINVEQLRPGMYMLRLIGEDDGSLLFIKE
jgi:hypothetical protein